ENVTELFRMFLTATNFSQDLSKWKIKNNVIKNTRLKFDARLLALSTRIEKFDNKKIQYGIYIETKADESSIEFNAPLVFKKLPQ
ncbi:hypothetical protein, partial [Mycoplasmopsis bovis]|uniref:hypothetical protein n=1 Tax=Mycoplasmopsis bovis TaxID=28903 RepID=UPI003D2E7B24